MGATTKEDLAAVVAAIEAKGMRVVHADNHAHHGRMLTVVVDEGEADKVTIFEIWPDEFMPYQIADKAVVARDYFGPNRAYEIGVNPRIDVIC